MAETGGRGEAGDEIEEAAVFGSEMGVGFETEMEDLHAALEGGSVAVVFVEAMERVEESYSEEAGCKGGVLG